MSREKTDSICGSISDARRLWGKSRRLPAFGMMPPVPGVPPGNLGETPGACHRLPWNVALLNGGVYAVALNKRTLPWNVCVAIAEIVVIGLG